MMCFNGLRGGEEASRSQEIDRIIRKDQLRMAHETKILLLGKFSAAHDSKYYSLWLLALESNMVLLRKQEPESLESPLYSSK